MGHDQIPGGEIYWRYWNSGEYACAIVAVLSADIDWAAYIGGYNGQRESECVSFVAESGEKLSDKEAGFFFPSIKLPYRW